MLLFPSPAGASSKAHFVWGLTFAGDVLAVSFIFLLIAYLLLTPQCRRVRVIFTTVCR